MQGHPDGRLVHRALVDQPVLAELEAVVGHEHEQGRVEQAELVEGRRHPAHAVVDGHQRLGVLLHEAVEVGPAVVHPVDAVPARALGPHPVGLAAVVLVGVGHRRRPDVAAVGVGAAVPLGRRERGVHRLVGQVEQERTVLVAVVQELDRVVGQQIGGVPLPLDAGSVDVERRIDVRPLPPERDPVVEPGARVVAGAAHVPLADERGVVAGGLQPDGERRQVAGHGGAVVEHLVGVGVEPRQDRRPARRAQRRGDERVLEEDAALGEPIEVRRLEVVVAEPEPVEPLVVGEDEDDVPRPADARARLLAALGPGRRRPPERPRRDQACREPPCAVRHVGSPPGPSGIRSSPRTASRRPR